MPSGNPNNTDPRNTDAYKWNKKNNVPYEQQLRFYKGKYIPVGKWENIMAGNLNNRTDPNAPTAPAAGGAPIPGGSAPGTVPIFMGGGQPNIPPHIPSGPFIPSTSNPGNSSTTYEVNKQVYMPGTDRSPYGTQAPYTPGQGRPPVYTPGQGRTPMPSGGGTTSPAPPWWVNQAYANPTEEQAFANAANAILPTLSPEDQRTMANYLAVNFKDVFGGYANAQFAPIPTKLTNERFQYLNPDRANEALGILNRMKAATGGKGMGKGFDFLVNAVNLLNRYSVPGGGPMTREKFAQFQNAIKSMTASMGGDISAYKNLAQMFNMPTFSAGPLVSNAANNKLIT